MTSISKTFVTTKTVATVAAILVALSLSTGCASSGESPDYRAAKGAGYGYQERKIAEDRYRVSYKGRGNKRGDARDYAMLRAAELTLLEGYDWFVVVREDTQVDRGDMDPSAHGGFGASTSYRSGPAYVTTRECGLLTCTSRTRPASTSYAASLHSGSHAQPSHRTSTEASLEIRMGRGVRPASQKAGEATTGESNGERNESYDAQEVRDSLKPDAGQR